MPNKTGEVAKTKDKSKVKSAPYVDRELYDTVQAKLKREKTRNIAKVDYSDLVENLLRVWLKGKVLPILGRVAGGTPVLAQEYVEGQIVIPARLARGASYVLEVSGDSMAPRICEGDLVVVREQFDAEHGEIVVVGEDDSACVKRLWKQGRTVELRSDNPAYEPLLLQEGRILGKVLAVIGPV